MLFEIQGRHAAVGVSTAERMHVLWLELNIAIAITVLKLAWLEGHRRALAHWGS